MCIVDVQAKRSELLDRCRYTHTQANFISAGMVAAFCEVGGVRGSFRKPLTRLSLTGQTRPL